MLSRIAFVLAAVCALAQIAPPGVFAHRLTPISEGMLVDDSFGLSLYVDRSSLTCMRRLGGPGSESGASPSASSPFSMTPRLMRGSAPRCAGEPLHQGHPAMQHRSHAPPAANAA